MFSVYAGNDTRVAGKASKSALNVDIMEPGTDLLTEGQLTELALYEDMGAILPEFGFPEGDCLDSFMDLSNFVLLVRDLSNLRFIQNLAIYSFVTK